MQDTWNSPKWRRISFTGLVVAGLAVVMNMNSQPSLIDSSTPDLSAVVSTVENFPVPDLVTLGSGQSSYEGGYVESKQSAHYDKSFSSDLSCQETESAWMDSLDRAGFFYKLSHGTGQSSIRLKDSKYDLAINFYEPSDGGVGCLGTFGASVS